jgi:hypothetical protein
MPKSDDPRLRIALFERNGSDSNYHWQGTVDGSGPTERK